MFKKILITKWANDAKTLIAVKAIMLDDNIQQMQISKFDSENNLTNDYQELMKVYSEEQIEADTQKIIEDRNAENQNRRQKEIAEKEERIKQQQIQKLFEAKLETFEIEEIKQSTNRELRSRIRRAKNIAEVYALAAVMLMQTNIKSDDEQTE